LRPIYSSARYFLFREHPFRVLAMHGLGFVEPPRTNQRDSLFHVWWFMDKSLAKRVAHSCDHDSPVLVGEKSDYLRRGARPGGSFTPPPRPARSARTINLEDLA